MIFHVKDQHDSQFSSKQIQLILEVISYAYANATKEPLKVYCVPGKVKDISKFAANKKDSRFKKNNKLPSDYYLL